MIVRLLTAIVAVVFFAQAARADAWHWCYMETGAGDSTVRYFTGMTYAPTDDKHAISLAFRAHVHANYDSRTTGRHCSWEEGKGDAIAARDGSVKHAREMGWRIIQTGWTWAGD